MTADAKVTASAFGGQVTSVMAPGVSGRFSPDGRQMGSSEAPRAVPGHGVASTAAGISRTVGYPATKSRSPCCSEINSLLENRKHGKK